MTHVYLVAPRSRMIIRLVEPAELARRIVDERRPLSLDAEVSLDDDRDAAKVVLGIIVCVAIIAGLAGLAAWSLQQFLGTLA